ncbi:helix-turn-helix domain-containing protein [Candidatus Woesearchaeota archaeon]|nr:helix-turn-helix domain-containing protein [Candidatus Woesearchaeota archaeon]
MVKQSKSETQMYQVTWIILNAVKHLHVGKIKLAQFLKGSKSKEVKPISNEVVYGGLMWFDIPTITGFIEQLENMTLIQRKIIQGYSRDYPILELTQAGKLVIDEKKQIPLQIIKQIKPATVGESEKETLKLIQDGKTVSEVAKERNLVESTIYTHIFRLISNDYLACSDVIPKETILMINETAKKLPSPTVKEVKELLPEVSYDEIRCVLAALQKENQNETN